jgi:hypothetical protein
MGMRPPGCQSIKDPEWQLQRLLHLSAMAHAVQTPVAQVLAVVGQQAIIVLAEARAGAPDYFVGRKQRLGVFDDAYRVTDAKSR